MRGTHIQVQKHLSKLLVVREDKLGDSCLSLPVLEALRHESPQTRVLWISQPAYRPLFSGQPNVELAWGCTRKPKLIEQFRIARRIRAWKPDAALLLRPNSPRWRRIAWLAGVPVRIGCEYSEKRGLLTRNVYEPSWISRHEARKTLDMLAAALGKAVQDYPARIILEPKTEAATKKAIDSLSLPDPFFAVQLGMGGSSQAFPPEFFAKAASVISEEFGIEPVLTGSKEEITLADQFKSLYRKPTRSLIGKTSFPELAELVSRSSFVLSVDTGITHIASGVGTPCVVMMPKLEVLPERWAPWSSTSLVVRPQEFCRACSSRGCVIGEGTCVRTTSLEEVIEACRQMLS